MIFKGGIAMSEINRLEYPQLNKLLWDTKATYFTPDVVRSVYERRWGFVLVDQLEPNEIQLLRTLQNEVGCFLPISF